MNPLTFSKNQNLSAVLTLAILLFSLKEKKEAKATRDYCAGPPGPRCLEALARKARGLLGRAHDVGARHRRKHWPAQAPTSLPPSAQGSLSTTHQLAFLVEQELKIFLALTVHRP